MDTKLQTLHFVRRYPTKPNTALESKAAFVHLNCIDEQANRVNEAFAFLSRTVNNCKFNHDLLYYNRPVRFIIKCIMKMFPRKSQFLPMKAPQNGRFTKNNNQYNKQTI
jgi:hypothetical protein